ncbi:unnamed protein product [Candidula unifasciata]|uniref:EGF-like domain-containing protein n=1 Tax=Candidula unifasciata TaxID=100452 RepID=A0A8S3YIU4_9EUPU|nr:unnamed protein product [Candidula unifasciata]
MFSSTILSFYLSWIQACTFGWFGPVCKYKCRCTADSCDLDGVCTGTSRCKPGWFGPACQYADVAYRTNSIPEAIDGNDNTCISSLKEEYIVIELNGSYIFTWLRILLSQAGFLATLQVKYLTKASIMECINGSSFNVDNLTIDIVCHIPMQIFGVNITGEGLKYLCSVYISGGRNLALREKARQTSVYSELINNVRFNFTADKAVDSRPNGRLHQGTGCAHTLQSSSMSEKWCVTFSQPRRINRYVIYNRLGGTCNCVFVCLLNK